MGTAAVKCLSKIAVVAENLISRWEAGTNDTANKFGAPAVYFTILCPVIVEMIDG